MEGEVLHVQVTQRRGVPYTAAVALDTHLLPAELGYLGVRLHLASQSELPTAPHNSLRYVVQARRRYLQARAVSVRRDGIEPAGGLVLAADNKRDQSSVVPDDKVLAALLQLPRGSLAQVCEPALTQELPRLFCSALGARLHAIHTAPVARTDGMERRGGAVNEPLEPRCVLR